VSSWLRLRFVRSLGLMSGEPCAECGAVGCVVGSGVDARALRRPGDASTMSLCELIATQGEGYVPGEASRAKFEKSYSPEFMRVLQEERQKRGQ
jgi:hypothetical protein